MSLLTGLRTNITERLRGLEEGNGGMLKDVLTHTFLSGQDLLDIVRLYRTRTPVGILSPFISGIPIETENSSSPVQRIDITYQFFFAIVDMTFNPESKSVVPIEEMHDLVLSLLKDVSIDKTSDNIPEDFANYSIYPIRLDNISSYYNVPEKTAAIIYEFNIRAISKRRCNL